MYFKYRFYMFKNGWMKYNQEKRLKFFFLLTLAILFAIGEYRFFYKIFTYLNSEVEFLSKHLTIQLVNILNLTFLSMLFFSNLTNAIYYFYVSDDLPLMLSYPIKNSYFILNRYLNNTIASSWMVIFAIIPFYVAIYKSFSFDYYVLYGIFIAYFPLFLMLSSLGCIVTIFIVNYFPAKKAYQILWSLSALFIAFIFVIIRMIRPERLFRPVSENEFMNFIKTLETPEYPYLPSTWVTKAFSALAFEKSIESYCFYIFLLTFVCLMALSVFLFLANKIYIDSFSRASSDFRKKSVHKSRLDIIGKFLPFSTVKKQFFIKDLKEILRDTGQWSQLLLLLGLVFVYLFSIKNLPIEHVITMNMVAFFNTGILEFILSALINRFIFPVFSLEGKVMWIIKSYPITMKEIFISKFTLYFIPLLFFGTLLSLFSNKLLKVDGFIYFFTFINIFVMTGTLVFLGLSLGIIFPRFKFNNVTEVSFSYGGIVYMLISMLYVGVGLILQSRNVYIYLKSKLFAQTITYTNFIFTFGLFVLCSIILCIYFYKRAKLVWEKWE